MGEELTVFAGCEWFRMQLGRCQAFASACAFVRFGSLTTARLAEYDGTGHKSTPFFFYILSSYHTCDQCTPRILLSSKLPASSHPHRHRTRRVASYCTTSHCPCECCVNNSRSSLIFSRRHICYHVCRRQPHRHLH